VEINYLDGSSWVWPHISRRAHGRDKIGLWSSDNLAASLNGSAQFIEILDEYLGISSAGENCRSSSNSEKINDILQAWNIPKAFSGNVYKWQHQE